MARVRFALAVPVGLAVIALLLVTAPRQAAAEALVAAAAPLPPRGPGAGYWLVAGDGGVFSFGPSALFQGSAGAIRLNQPIVGMAATPDGGGYWLVARDGGIFTYGNAVFYGSTGALRLNQPIVGMAATIDGDGYWLLAADGGVFSFGDAPFLGSAVGTTSPAVAIAADPSGWGYRILTQGGEVFGFAVPSGGSGLDGAVGIAMARSGGYWIASRSGWVAALGGAIPYGHVTTPLNAPIVGLAATPDGGGYYLLGADGGVFSFGDAIFEGSTGNLRLNSPVLGIAVPSRPPTAAVISVTDDGQTVNVHPGDTVEVVRGTCCGANWRVTANSQPGVLVFVGENDITDPHHPAFGVARQRHGTTVG